MKFLKHLVAVVSIVVATSSQAAFNTSYDFGKWLGSSPTFQPVDNFASLQVSSSDDQNFLFRLTALSNLSDVFGSNAYVDAIIFDTKTNNDPRTTTVTLGDWGTDTFGVSLRAPHVGGIAFDFKNFFGNAYADRLIAGESIEWVANFLSVQPNPVFENPGIALHVAGFDQSMTNGVNSGWYVPSLVSIPSTWLLLLAGGILLVVSRRKQ